MAAQYKAVNKTFGGVKVDTPIAFNMGIEQVPRYPSFGYSALTHGGAGNGLGYYSVSSAYPSYDGSCTRFGPRPCGGVVQNSTFPNGQPPTGLPSAMNQESGAMPVRPVNNSPHNDKP